MEIVTIFYSKTTGLIKAVNIGRSDLGYFGSFADDYAHILDFVVLESGIPQDFGKNYTDYKIDLATKQLTAVVKNQYIERLEQENAALKADLELTKAALDDIIMNLMV